MASRGVAVMAVDWYGLDPRTTPWSKVPEAQLASQVMRYNQGPMHILLDPKFTQVEFDKFRTPDGDYIDAVLVDANRVIRWVGGAHDVAAIRRAVETLVPQTVTGAAR